MADEPAAPPKPKKKLPFKPTALRKNVARRESLPDDASGDEKKEDDDGLDLFRRSKEMVPIMEAERLRKALRKQRQLEEQELQRIEEEKQRMQAERQRREDENERRSSSGQKRSRDDQEQQDELQAPPDNAEAASPVLKHRRDSDADSYTTAPFQQESPREPVTPPASKRSRHGSSSIRTPSSSARKSNVIPDESPSRRSLRSNPQPPSPVKTTVPLRQSSRLTPQKAQVISLDSDDEDNFPTVLSDDDDDRSSVEVVERISPNPPIPQEPEEEDDMFAEYVRKAEEQRKRDLAQLGESLGRDPAKASVEIYVTSEVPGCGRPCRVKFLFSKPLKLVRDTWLAQQLQKGANIPKEERENIVLTWRRKKVYNASTLLSLGIRPQRDGRLAVDGYSADGLSSQRTQVHMEAWTAELFQTMQQEEELRRRREAGEDMSDDNEEPEPEVEDTKFRVMLQARNMEQVNLTVRPETTVETLITGFRAQTEIESDKEIALWFDGEKLEEHVTMAEADVQDLDSLEVHIK